MAKLFRRMFRTVKRRLKQGLRDQRTFNLHRAGVRLLAAHDHEQVSVAQLAEGAGISVGAFYQRFPNKEAFLGRLVHERMGAAERTLERDLDPARWRHRSAGAITRAIVTTTMQSLQGPGAGVVRAALQRGHSDREKLASLVRYRTAVADRAVALLAPLVKGVHRPDRAVRATVQIAMATSLDALLHDADVLRPGHQRMVDVLSAMMLRLLDLRADARLGKGADAGDEPAPADDADEDALLEMPIEEVVATEVTASPPVATQRRRRPAATVSEPIPVIRPAQVRPVPEETAETPEPTPRRRHRPRL